jgi:hypothetical protein
MAEKPLKDTKEVPFDNPLVGRLIHPGAEDPTKIGETDFRTLQNIRYTLTGIRGTSGMTKVNSNALPAVKITDGMQFNKYLPVGTFSYNIAHVTDGVSSSALVRSNNTASPPNPDTYSTLIASMNYGSIEMTTTPDGGFVVCDGVTNWIWGGEEFRCASFLCPSAAIAFPWVATVIEDFTQQVNNALTDDPDVALLPWVTSGFYPYQGPCVAIMIGSTRPLNGIKFYISTPNTSPSVSLMVVKYYSGSGTLFDNCTNVVDGTASGGITFAKTGIISFDDTKNIVHPRVINGTLLYWYVVYLQSTSATPTIKVSSCTLLASAQPLKDIWDGVDRAEASFQIATTAGVYTDNSSAVLNNIYPADNTSGAGYYYSDLSTLPNTSFLYVGFTERMCGMKFNFANPSTTSAGTTCTVSYWNGDSWVTVTNQQDFTDGFDQSGIIQWLPPSADLEFQLIVGQSKVPFYFYQISFANTFSATVHLYYAAGIPVQTPIQPHSLPLLWQNRLWLLCNLQGKANEALCSSAGTNCVFNGTDSIILNFGDETPILAAGALYSRYGGSLYDDLIVVKAYQTYLIDGTSPSTWVVYTIAPNVGITAPKTFTICDTGYELAPGLTKHIAAWVATSGPVMFDGNGIIPIEMDIKGFWDPGSSYYVAPSVMALASAWFDSVFREWHLTFAGMEWVYDVNKKKWWQANRGTGKALACGWVVKNGKGFSYSFAGTSDGSIECLENGTTMDGNPIVYDVRTGDTPPAKSGMVVTTIRHVKLIAKTKQHADTVTFNWYGDRQRTPTQVKQLDQSTQYAEREVYQAVMGSGPGTEMQAVFHSFEAIVTTTEETIGFEPVMISGAWEYVREDVYGKY